MSPPQGAAEEASAWLERLRRSHWVDDCVRAIDAAFVALIFAQAQRLEGARQVRATQLPVRPCAHVCACLTPSLLPAAQLLREFFALLERPGQLHVSRLAQLEAAEAAALRALRDAQTHGWNSSSLEALAAPGLHALPRSRRNSTAPVRVYALAARHCLRLLRRRCCLCCLCCCCCCCCCCHCRCC